MEEGSALSRLVSHLARRRLCCFPLSLSVFPTHRVDPPQQVLVQVHLVEEGDSHTVFDFGLFSQDQTLLLAAHGYRAAIISAPGEAGS